MERWRGQIYGCSEVKQHRKKPGAFCRSNAYRLPLVGFDSAITEATRAFRSLCHHPSKMVTMVFPGDIIPAGANIGLSRDDITTFQKAIQNVEKDNKLEPSAIVSVPTGILIVIDYRSAEKVEHHQTGYVLNLYYRDPAQPKSPGPSLPIGLDETDRI